jgi:putative spermidine/putrescine transport system ATP-binding protein
MAEIKFRQVTKAYGDLRAVDDVSFDVAAGEFMTVLGPSGSGKTTLLTLLAGLAPLSAGEIWIAGRDVTKLEPARRKIGLVFQSYALFPHLTVFDNVAFALSVRGCPHAEISTRVAETLRLVRLEALGARKPAQLSGGQQQRVALARAIVFRPDILLLDEPLSALDRKLRDELQIELRSLQRTLNITTLLVTHDQEEALSLSDRIVVLDHGKIQQIDAPEIAYRQPANRFVAEFLGTANVFSGEVVTRDGRDALVAGSGIELALAAAPEWRGRAALALVRPENLRVGAPGGGIAARHEASVFLGVMARHHFRLPNGQSVVATSHGELPHLAPDEPVSLHVQPESVWLIPPNKQSQTN